MVTVEKNSGLIDIPFRLPVASAITDLPVLSPHLKLLQVRYV